MISQSLQSKITLVMKIFFIGMVWQFLAHTILTYGLHLPSFLSFIWVWKEVVIIIVGLILSWFFIINKEYRIQLLHNRIFIIILTSIILSFIISLATSLIIHHQSITQFAISAKFNYIPLFIFIVGVGVSYALSKEQNEHILATLLTTIKWVLVFSLFWYGILHTIPNVLDHFGFSQPGMSIEWTENTPPPSLYLTDFYTGYVRNQGPFGGPLSLGFYLVAMWPFFFGLQLYKKKLSDVWGRWLLYFLIVLSTYSRAAWGIFLISCAFLFGLLYKKYSKYIILGGLAIIVGVTVYILGGGTSELFLRTWSDKGHIEYFIQGLELIKQHRLWGLGAASVGPGSNHIDTVEKVFNPENQYMQIWLEYGLIGIISWALSYFLIVFQPLQLWIRSQFSKITEQYSKEKIMYIGIDISIVSLAVAGMVLHPFVDSSSIYPFMLAAGLVFGFYHQYRHLHEQDHDTKLKKNKTNKYLSSNQSSIVTTIQILERPKNILATSPQSHHIQNNQKTNIIPYIWTILISIFFVLQTYLTFGLRIIDSTIILSTLRDTIFALFIGTTIIWGWKYIRSFFQLYWKIIIPILTLLLINIYFIFSSDGNILSAIAGIKYDIFQFIILGGGIWIGYLIYKKKESNQLCSYIQRFLKRALIILGISVLWQLGKNIVPNVFLNYLGYTSPNDFIPYTKPPIYYITGSGGVERLNGLFVGPNTLGFFLVLMTSVLYFFIKQRVSKKMMMIIASLYLGVTLLTLSRGAIIGIMLQIIILIGYETWITGKESFRHTTNVFVRKKIGYVILTLILSGIALFSINIWKTDSNTERSNSKDTIYTIVKNHIPILGYGPGYVGPARHYTTDYIDHQKNDNAMLENIYLQTFINQGWIGIILFFLIWGWLYYVHYQLMKSTVIISKNDLFLTQTTQYMGLGLLGLLSIGWFLHIFIDSMVNYLFFLPYSILIGYSYGLIFSKASVSMK